VFESCFVNRLLQVFRGFLIRPVKYRWRYFVTLLIHFISLNFVNYRLPYRSKAQDAKRFVKYIKKKIYRCGGPNVGTEWMATPVFLMLHVYKAQSKEAPHAAQRVDVNVRIISLIHGE